MLARLQGIFEGTSSNGVIINVQGLGFEVYVSSQTQSKMPSIGNPIKLETLLLFRQDQPHLFGFISREEKDVFEILLTVQGVGPRVGLAILGYYPSSKLLWILKSDDQKALIAIEGVGPKLARRLLNELKDKLEKLETISLAKTDSNLEKKGGELIKKKKSSKEDQKLASDSGFELLQQEAILALEALGYEKNHIFSMIHQICQENEKEGIIYDSSQDLIKATLRRLSPMVASGDNLL